MSSEEKKKDAKREPQLRFRGFTGAWEQRQLGELARKTGSGGTPSSRNREYYGGDIPFLSISDIQGRTVSKTQKHLTNKGLSASAAWIVPAGSITFSMYASYGKVAILGSPMATSQAFFNLVFDDSATRDFIFSQLESFSLRHKWDRIVSTGTQPNLTAGDLKQTLITLPSMEERTQIGKLFSTLDSLIAAAERQQELLKLQKLAYLQRMFPRNGEKKPRLRFPGFTGDWECQKIGEIIKTYPRTHYLAANIRSEGQFPVIQQGNTPIAGYTDGNPFNEYQQIVLFGDHTLSLYKPLSPFFIATDGVQIIGSDKVSASILYYLLKRYMPTDKGYKRHYSELKHTCCCFPPTNREQEQIGVFFEYLDSLITAAADRINTFLLLKRGYMQKMFI